MNIIQRALGSRRAAAGAATLDDALASMLGVESRPTAAGVTVSVDTALTSTVVYACVRVIAETIASLPLVVYQRQGNGRKRADQHPLSAILHDAPNPEMTSTEYLETMAGNVLLWQHAYAEIERGPGGSVRALWPLRPDKMTVERDSADRLVYLYDLPDGQRVAFRRDQIHHWRGFGASGLTALSTIGAGRQAIGTALAVEEYGARFFGNDSRPGGVLQHPTRLSKEAAERLKASWEGAFRGLSNRHRVAVLEEGVTWQQVGIPPQEAQYLESRKYSAAEIARLYRVPLHLIGELDRATWGNIEHQAIDFVMHTIRPWAVRIERVIQRDLFGPAERRYYAEFLVDGLLRGDAVTRAQALQTQLQNGVITPNEWRALENRNPMEGGDRAMVNAALVPLDQAGTMAQQGQQEQSE